MSDYRFERYDCPGYTETPEELAELFIGRCGPTNRAYQALKEKNDSELETTSKPIRSLLGCL